MNLSDYFMLFLDRDEISNATRGKYYYRLSPFVLRHGLKSPSEITTLDVVKFIESKPELADPSKALLRAAFHAFFNFMIELEAIEVNPVAKVRKWRDYPRRINIPSQADVDKALATAVAMNKSSYPRDIRDGLIFALAVVSGNRRGELRQLPLNDLLEALQTPETLPDGEKIYRVYTEGKTGEAICRFTSFHVPLIENYLDIRPVTNEPAVFVNLNKTHKNYGQQLSLVAFDRVRPRVCRRAGVEIITYQELRRLLATKIATAVNVDVAAQALNHSPHSGSRVIRVHYYDPDKAQADKAVSNAFKL